MLNYSVTDGTVTKVASQVTKTKVVSIDNLENRNKQALLFLDSQNKINILIEGSAFPVFVLSAAPNNATEIFDNLYYRTSNYLFVAKSDGLYRVYADGTLDTSPTKVGPQDAAFGMGTINSAALITPDGSLIPSTLSSFQNLIPSSALVGHDPYKMVYSSVFYNRTNELRSIIVSKNKNDNTYRYTISNSTGVLANNSLPNPVSNGAEVVMAGNLEPGYYSTLYTYNNSNGALSLSKTFDAITLLFSDGMIRKVLLNDDGSVFNYDGKNVIFDIPASNFYLPDIDHAASVANMRPTTATGKIYSKNSVVKGWAGSYTPEPGYFPNYITGSGNNKSYISYDRLSSSHTPIDNAASLDASNVKAENGQGWNEIIDLANSDVNAYASMSSSFNNLSRPGWTMVANGPGVNFKASASEVAIAPDSIVGLNDSGYPYYKGVLPTSDFSTISVVENLPIVIGENEVNNLVATKGKFHDKIVVTWEGTTSKYKVQPQLCNTSGASCTNVGAELTITGKSFEHTVDNGLQSEVKQTSGNRMVYKVASTREEKIYLNSTDGVQGVSSGTYATSNVSYLSSPPTATSATGTVNSNSETNELNLSVTDVDESNEYTYQILTQPEHGLAELDSNGKLKYVADNYFGDATFTYRVTDGSGANVDGTATVTVVCPAPEIVSFSGPSSVKAYENNLYTVKYKANLCNGTNINYKFVPSNETGGGENLTKTGILPSSTVEAKGILSLSDPEPGKYAIALELSSTSSAEHKVTADITAVIPGLSTPTMSFVKAAPTEDDQVSTAVEFSGKDCQMFGSLDEARQNNGCYVAWTASFNDFSVTVSGSKATMASYADEGAHTITANVYKADSSGEMHLVKTLTDAIWGCKP